MLELHLAREQMNQLAYTEPEHKLGLVERARHLFYRAYVRGQLAGIWSKFTGRSARLLELAAVEASQTIIGR
jgi:hypothetical protein